MHMGTPRSPCNWRTSGTSSLRRFLLLTLLQMCLQSSPGDCSSRRGGSTIDKAVETPSWDVRVPNGNEPDLDFKSPARHGSFQTVEEKLNAPVYSAPTSVSNPGAEETIPVARARQRPRPATVHTELIVNQFGTGDYGTVQDAIDAVPTYNTQRVVIRIFAGTYREKVYIPSNRPFVTLIGEGNRPPIISWNDTAASTGSTWDSSTIAIDAANFIAQGITFENSAPAPPAGAVGAQAIALRIGGDMAAFYNCNFLGAQDTLCDWMGRHYFQNCFIQGSIDFIFGDGQSLYEGCTINSIATQSGSITAHYRQTSDDASGYSFVNSRITGTGLVLLGRAWGPYSRVVFSSTTMSNVVDPLGWSDWGTPSYDGTVYFGEFNNFGPGADLINRVGFSQALTQTQAAPFLTVAWIDGADWLDQSMSGSRF